VIIKDASPIMSSLGDVYEGLYYRDQKSGEGKYSFANGGNKIS
jgi:hypothetical protein